MQNRNACGTCGTNFFGLFWLLIRTFFGLQVHLTKRISMLVLQFSRLATISIMKLHFLNPPGVRLASMRVEGILQQPAVWWVVGANRA